jgi:hypothetical protein
MKYFGDKWESTCTRDVLRDVDNRTTKVGESHQFSSQQEAKKLILQEITIQHI